MADICLFFKTDGFTTSDINIDQFALVSEFKKKISGLGCYRVDFKEIDFENLARKLLTNILLNWESYERRINVIETTPLEMQIDDIDDDMGYYDAIYKSIDELNASTDITLLFINAMQSFNFQMKDTTEKLKNCIIDQDRTKIINIFSSKMDDLGESLSLNCNQQMTHLINSMNYFDLSSKIYLEDFTDPSEELKMLLPIFKNNIQSFEKSLITIENLSSVISTFPRATTKLNKSKKQLIKSLDDLYEHQSDSIRILEDSQNKLVQLISEYSR